MLNGLSARHLRCKDYASNPSKRRVPNWLSVLSLIFASVPAAGVCNSPGDYRDTLPERRFRHLPLWAIPVTLVYAPCRITFDIKNPELEQELSEWQHYYNWLRPHGSLKGKTPIDVICELMPKTPYVDDVVEQYDVTKERFQEQNYKLDLRIRKLKPSL